MKIFVSLKVPRENIDLRAASLALADAIRRAGHTPFIAWQEIEANRASLDQGLSPQQFMPFVRDHLRSCDLLLLLYHPELRGGLIELGIAYAYEIPIWLAFRRGESVSSSVQGCADQVLEYTTMSDLQEMVYGRLKSMKE
jgi:hypothetical protein